MGGGSDDPGMAFLVNLTLKKKTRKTKVQEAGEDKERWQEELPSEPSGGTISHIWKM